MEPNEDYQEMPSQNHPEENKSGFFKRKIANFCQNIGLEPVLALYMFSTFVKLPIFQSLIFDKLCIENFHDYDFCRNATAVHANEYLQSRFNRIFLLSSLVLGVPSIFVALLLGAASDSFGVKIPLLIPFVGLVLSDVSYIVQTVYINFNPLYLLISDALFGLCGGFSAIIALTFAYGIHQTGAEMRSVRIAMLEGSIGIGGTLGYACSGLFKRCLGYTNAFLLLTFIHCTGFFYLILLAKDYGPTNYPPITSFNEGYSVNYYLRIIISKMGRLLRDCFDLVKNANNKRALWLMLIAFSLEYLTYAGQLDVQYAFLRYKLAWGPLYYGWFSALGYGLSTLMVMTAYPLLIVKWFDDNLLARIGLLFKIVSLLCLAVLLAEWLVLLVVVFAAFNRFVSVGMRSVVSRLVSVDDMGKLFALIALLESLLTPISSVIFNNLFPWTLEFYAGTCFILMAALLLIPFGILRHVAGITNV